MPDQPGLDGMNGWGNEFFLEIFMLGRGQIRLSRNAVWFRERLSPDLRWNGAVGD